VSVGRQVGGRCNASPLWESLVGEEEILGGLYMRKEPTLKVVSSLLIYVYIYTKESVFGGSCFVLCGCVM